MKYNVQLAWKSLIRNRFVTIVQIICLCLGLLIASMFLCQANGAYYHAKINDQYLNTENLILVNTNLYQETNDMTIDHLNEIKSGNEMIEEIHFMNRYIPEQIIINNKYQGSIEIFSVNEGLESLYEEGYFKKGSWFIDKNDCIIGEIVALTHDLDIHDKIILDDETFTISGILKNKRSIIIRHNSLQDKSLQNPSYYILAKELNSHSIQGLTQYIKSKFPNSKYYFQNEIDKLEYDKLLRGWTASIIIVMLTLLYSFFNIFNIISFFIKKHENNIGIMMSFGAMKKDVFIQKFLEISLINILSCFLVYGFLFGLQISNIMNTKFGLFIYVGMIPFLITLLFSFFMIFVLLAITLRKTLKKEIAQIYR